MRSRYSATPWFTSIAVYALVYAALALLKINLDAATRFFYGAMISSLCGLIPTLLIPKLALHNNNFIVTSIVLAGGVFGVLTNFLVVVVAALVLCGFAIIVLLRQHWRSRSILEP